jgi:hypothetical protein
MQNFSTHLIYKKRKEKLSHPNSLHHKYKKSMSITPSTLKGWAPTWLREGRKIDTHRNQDSKTVEKTEV